jgi:hypothetical protein
MDKMYDKLGQEIKVGSIIVYGHALGRCAGLRIGKVLKVKVEKGVRDVWNRIEDKNRITIHGVDDDHSYLDHEPKLLDKKSTLLSPERTIVLDEKIISPKIKKLLDMVPV